jgi:hypothetical protein
MSKVSEEYEINNGLVGMNKYVLLKVLEVVADNNIYDPNEGEIKRDILNKIIGFSQNTFRFKGHWFFNEILLGFGCSIHTHKIYEPVEVNYDDEIPL